VLSLNHDIARILFLKPFIKDRRLQAHHVDNMHLTMLSQYTGSFSTRRQAFGEILDFKGTILSVTIGKATLPAELTEGSHIYGETAIDIPQGTQREKIRNVFLIPHHSDSISVCSPCN
jgi:2-phospho-L-lactate transferase/gluconeogenesis factor (CofD/UPF0052 family)